MVIGVDAPVSPHRDDQLPQLSHLTLTDRAPRRSRNSADANAPPVATIWDGPITGVGVGLVLCSWRSGVRRSRATGGRQARQPPCRPRQERNDRDFRTYPAQCPARTRALRARPLWRSPPRRGEGRHVARMSLSFDVNTLHDDAAMSGERLSAATAHIRLAVPSIVLLRHVLIPFVPVRERNYVARQSAAGHRGWRTVQVSVSSSIADMAQCFGLDAPTEVSAEGPAVVGRRACSALSCRWQSRSRVVHA
jgi:hypothetical protein